MVRFCLAGTPSFGVEVNLSRVPDVAMGKILEVFFRL